MAKVVDYSKRSKLYNAEADANEELFKENRQKTFDDGAGEPRDSLNNMNAGKAFDWPDDMKKYFDYQNSINDYMDFKMNGPGDEDI